MSVASFSSDSPLVVAGLTTGHFDVDVKVQNITICSKVIAKCIILEKYMTWNNIDLQRKI